MGIMSFFRRLCGCFGGSSPQKPKIAQLVQRARERAITVEKAADEVGLRTGPMGGCVSVIYLYGRAIGTDQSGEWLYMGGQHGSGGTHNINWEQLFANLTPTPNDRAWVIAAPGAAYSFKDHEVTEGLLTVPGASCITWWRADISDALVLMDGELKKWEDPPMGGEYIQRPNMLRGEQ